MKECKLCDAYHNPPFYLFVVNAKIPVCGLSCSVTSGRLALSFRPINNLAGDSPHHDKGVVLYVNIKKINIEH